MESMARTSCRDSAMTMNGYSCIACGKAQAVDFAGFTCPACGENLEITYDYAHIRETFVPNYDYAPFPLKVGRTALIAAPRLGKSLGLKNLYLKDETSNPSASTKDRATAIALQRAIDVGAKTISVASTGNAGSSLACLAAALDMRAIVFVPESAPVAKLTQALAFGATVLAVRGNYDDAFDLCLKASDEFGWFNRSTGYNPFTREGKKTCAYEIWEDLGRIVPDRVVVSSGDGNLLSGMWKGWRDLHAAGLIGRLPKIDCAQSENSAAICTTVRRLRDQGDTNPDWSKVVVDQVNATTVADSISVNRPRDGLAAVKGVLQSGGEAVTVPDKKILAAIPEIARNTGVFAEPAAAAPWAAVQQMAENNTIDSDELVVCLVSGSGLKDVANAATAVGNPMTVDPTTEAVREVLEISE